MKAPNIVFCHVDQLHHEAMSALGNPFVSTPSLDEIRQAGVSFNRAQASHPLCCPSRSSWYTGRMPSEHGALSNGINIGKDIPDLGQWMTPRGYDCYYGGKWHVPGRQQEPSFKIVHPPIHIGERGDEGVADAGEQFLTSYKGDKPFFLSLGFLDPHDCCYMSFPDKMPAMKFGLEEILAGKMPPAPPGYNPKLPLGKAAGEWNVERVQLHNYVYYRMVEAVDEAVGRVFRALRHSRFSQDTVFIFSSDHGEMMGHKNKFGKNLLYENSLRVPLMIVAPGRVPENKQDDKCMTMGLDVTATILDYAGVESLPGMTVARSLRPVLEGKVETVHDYLPAETSAPGPHVSIRRGDSKSIINMSKGTMELYDTAKDPWEMKDLAADSAFAATVGEHQAMLADYQKRVEYCAGYKKFLADPQAVKNAEKGGSI